MGIFELVIIVAAAAIFIILVRRFPDTSENGAEAGPLRFRRPHFSLGLVSKPFKIVRTMLRRDTRPDHQFWPDDEKPVPNHLETARQYEPGSGPQELEHYSPALKQLLSEAGSHFDASRYREAEDQYLKAAALDPKCVLAYNRLGLIYLKRPEAMNDAEEAFRQAYKYDPSNGYILDNLGLVNFTKGLFNEAVGFYERSIAADTKVAERHAHLGLAYLSLRHYAKAVRHLARAWALEPSNDEYKQLLDDAKERERRLRLTRQ